MKNSSLFFLVMSLAAYVAFSQLEHEATDCVPVDDPSVQEKLEQWQDLKFSLLMHWGSYCQWGIVESWSICPKDYAWCARSKGKNPQNYFTYLQEYKTLKTTFNPVHFHPDKWATAAKQAGMRYIVFMTKHHDGYSMFDSKYLDYIILECSAESLMQTRMDI